MQEPIWIGADIRAPATEEVLNVVRRQLQSAWADKGGGEYLETVQTQKAIISGKEVEVTRVDWRTA